MPPYVCGLESLRFIKNNLKTLVHLFKQQDYDVWTVTSQEKTDNAFQTVGQD